MNTLMHNAEKALGEFIQSLDTDEACDPDQWLCLHIEDEAFNELRADPKRLYIAEDIILSCFQDVEGHTFFCGSQDLYILAKDVSSDILENMGQKLCEMLFKGMVTAPKINVFKLTSSGAEFVSQGSTDDSDRAPAPTGGLFHLSPVSFLAQEGMDRLAQKKPMEYLSDKKAQLVQEENRKPRVLLIEDDRTTAAMVSEALKPYCQMTVAHNASEGVEQFMQIEPDLVFLDIGLPDADGHNVLDWMLWNDPDANIVIFSGNSDMDNMARAMENGARGFVSKPFVKKRLLRYIEECPQHKKLH